MKKVTFDDHFTGDKDRKWNEKVPHKKGKFTPEEMEILKNAICRYVQVNNTHFKGILEINASILKEKGLGHNGLLKLITQKVDEETKGAWTTIAECLPDRAVQACYRQIRNKYHPDNYKGKWTPEEEQDLLKLVEEHGRKWELIGEKLGK